MLPVLAPLLCFCGIFLLLLLNRGESDWRFSFLFAAVIWGLIVVASSELLSIFRLLSAGMLLLTWLVCLLIVIVLLGVYILRHPSKSALRLKPGDGLRSSGLAVFLLGGILVIVAMIGLTAWVAPPNNFDAMTYHMSRVMHWIQNASIGDYPTQNLRQLYQNPWAEFALLHLQILSGGDHFANLLQWFSMLGSILGVSLLAKELGADRRGQVFASLVCATIPMGILQGSSVQNDYAGAFWLVCFAAFTLLFVTTQPGLFIAFGAGGALGLALLTKATGYIYAFPFVVWLGLTALKAKDKNRLLLVGLSLALAATINLGHLARNYNLFADPLGPGEEISGALTNQIFTPAALVSNVVRNLALHLSTPVAPVNAALEQGIARLHTLLRLSPSDPRTTMPGTEFHVLPLSNHEDYAGNPLHLFLIAFSLLLFIWDAHPRRLAGFYLLALAAAFLLFCAYLRWQPWNSRIQLPWFVLFSPFVGLELGRIQRQWLANIIVVLLLLSAFPWVLRNTLRPLVGRKNIFITPRVEQYFANQPLRAVPYIAAAQKLSEMNCAQVGLALNMDDWEYPIWALANQRQGQTIRFENVNLTNASAKLSDQAPFLNFAPCAILAVGEPAPAAITVGQRSFIRDWSASLVSLYRPGLP
jgi:hypothetical protein